MDHIHNDILDLCIVLIDDVVRGLLRFHNMVGRRGLLIHYNMVGSYNRNLFEGWYCKMDNLWGQCKTDWGSMMVGLRHP